MFIPTPSCFDKEFKDHGNTLIQEFRLGIKKLVLSDLVMMELNPAKDEVKAKLTETPTVLRSRSKAILKRLNWLKHILQKEL